MRSAIVPVLLAAGVSAAGLAGQQGVKVTSNAAIQKVIQMMNDMIAKGKAEKQDEKVRFAEFKMFCEMTAKEKEEAIAENTDAVEKLKADIGEANADAAQMAKDIGNLDADISAWEADRQQAQAMRKKAKEVFEKAHAEYDDSIDSVERAVETIKA